MSTMTPTYADRIKTLSLQYAAARVSGQPQDELLRDLTTTINAAQARIDELDTALALANYTITDLRSGYVV